MDWSYRRMAKTVSSLGGFAGYPITDKWMLGSFVQFSQLKLNSGDQDAEYLVVREDF